MKTPEYALKQLYWYMKWCRGYKHPQKIRNNPKIAAQHYIGTRYGHAMLIADEYVNDFREWLKIKDWRFELKDDWKHLRRVILYYSTLSVHCEGERIHFIRDRIGWNKWKKDFIGGKDMSRKAIVILSGGMDSTTLLYKMKNEGYELEALSFDYGQRHKKELQMANATCLLLKIPHMIIDISVIGKNLMTGSALTDNIDVPEGHYAADNMKATVVPNRNSIMLNLAMAYAISRNIDKIAYAAHSGDHAIYPDCRPAFIKQIKKLAKLVDYKSIEIMAPFMKMDKGDIAILGKKLGVNYTMTWTCYKGEDKPCGKCGACIERKEAFEKAKMKDPLVQHE